MFKVIANFDDPSQTVSFENYIDIFNPTKAPWPTTITLKQQLNAIKVLYSRENILTNLKFYFSITHPDTGLTSGPDWETMIHKLIDPIPDELLYLLHWFYFQAIDSDNKLHFIFHRFTDNYIGARNVLNFYCNPFYSQRTQYSYRGDNYPNEIVALLQSYERDHITPQVNRYPDTPLYRDAGTPSYTNSRLGIIYHIFLQGGAICRTTDGTYLLGSDLKRLLETDPNAQFIDSAPGAFDFHIKVIISKHNKAPLYRCLQYSASPTQLLSWPLTMKGEHDPILYGVELELASDYSVQQIVDATDEPFFIVKADSSVTGNKRYHYELATVPMSFKAHKKQWAYWFSNLDYEQFDTTRETNNGMHVHISRKLFSANHLKNFVWFWTQPAHIEFMKFFSQRDARGFQDYATIPQPVQGRSRVSTFQRQQSRVSEYRGCVHFSPKGTIEIRLFRGIVSLAEIVKNLEFVDSIFHYTMQGQNFTKMSLKEYVRWLHAQPKNKYAILKKYLERTEKLQTIIEAASLLDLIFTEKEPKKILDIVAKSRFEITNAHVTILNQRWKKRIFVLKDGKMILNPDHKGSLSSLDRLIEQRILGKAKNGQVVLAPTPPPQQESEDTGALTFTVSSASAPRRSRAHRAA